jgi:hypothetical protein
MHNKTGLAFCSSNYKIRPGFIMQPPPIILDFASVCSQPVSLLKG